MTASTDKLLGQLEQLRKAWQGERIKVKQPSVRLRKPKPRQWHDLYGRRELDSCIVAGHSMNVAKTAHNIDIRAIGDNVKKVMVGGSRYTVTCATCDSYWDVSEETAERIVKLLS